MPWVQLSAPRRWIRHPLTWVGVAAFACLVLLVLPRVQARYRVWTERRGIQRAAQAYLRGDFKQAVMDARGVLQKNPHSGEATRIVAKALEALQSPDALAWRRELDHLQSGDAENLLALAGACLKSADFDGARRALQRVKPEDQKTARFHELSAKLAPRNRDAESALKHWLEAVRLEPGNDEYRQGLAAVQLTAQESATRAAALETLEKMAADPLKPMLRLTALRILINDASTRKERSRLKALADTLAADPVAEDSDQLTRLGILRGARDPRANAYLAELQELAAPEPDKVFKLMTWMNENSLALAVLEWESKLAPGLATQPPVCAALAEAEARAVDWKGLKARVEGANWPNFEFVRLAYLSRALDRLEDAAGADAAWNNALATAQEKPMWLNLLAALVHAWGWKERTEETLWKLPEGTRHPQWALDFLWSTVLARGDSAKLCEVSKRFVATDPSNVAMRNNHVALALLIGQTADAPHELAATLFQQNPGEAVIGSTYGFSLFLRGKAKEAVAVMETFPAEELRGSVAGVYYGIFLAAAGEADRSVEYFQLGTKAKLLPEEKAMVNFLAPACRARVLDRSDDAGGSQTAWQEALAAAEARPEWLELLGRMALDWQWQPRAEELVLRLAAIERCPPWAGETLWQAALKSADAAQIHRAERLLAKLEPAKIALRVRPVAVSPAAPVPAAQPIDRTRRDTAQLFKEAREGLLADPKNVLARSNYLLLALLTGQSTDSARQLARALYKERSADAAVAACYGLSLFQQGKMEEAIAAMEKLEPGSLREPWVALYFGHFLAGSEYPDQVARAAEYFALAEKAALLPEERAFLPAAKP